MLETDLIFKVFIQILNFVNRVFSMKINIYMLTCIGLCLFRNSFTRNIVCHCKYKSLNTSLFNISSVIIQLTKLDSFFAKYYLS